MTLHLALRTPVEKKAKKQKQNWGPQAKSVAKVFAIRAMMDRVASFASQPVGGATSAYTVMIAMVCRAFLGYAVMDAKRKGQLRGEEALICTPVRDVCGSKLHSWCACYMPDDLFYKVDWSYLVCKAGDLDGIRDRLDFIVERTPLLRELGNVQTSLDILAIVIERKRVINNMLRALEESFYSIEYETGYGNDALWTIVKTLPTESLGRVLELHGTILGSVVTATAFYREMRACSDLDRLEALQKLTPRGYMRKLASGLTTREIVALGTAKLGRIKKFVPWGTHEEELLGEICAVGEVDVFKMLARSRVIRDSDVYWHAAVDVVARTYFDDVRHEECIHVMSAWFARKRGEEHEEAIQERVEEMM
jgi:hypothetical protein